MKRLLKPQIFFRLKPGDRVTWNTISGPCSGTVAELTQKGALVRVDGGGDMLLTILENRKKK